MCGKILKGIIRGFNWRFRRLKSKIPSPNTRKLLNSTG
jgi:hypothetical protein